MRLFAPALFLLLLASCTSLNSLRNQAQLTHQAPLQCALPVAQNNNLLVVPVEVAGQEKPLEFIFDTGASLTILSQARADEMGLKPIKRITIRDSRKQKSKLNVVMIPEISLGCARIQNVVAAVVDYGPNSLIPCIAPDGILGNNVIRLLNWKQQGSDTLYLSTSSLFNPADSILHILSITNAGRPLVNLTINNQVVADLLLDTGSGGSIDLSPTTAQMALSTVPPTFTEVDGSTQGLFGARVDTSVVYLPTLQMGSAETPAVVEVSANSKEKVGMAWLKNYTWILPAHQDSLVLCQPVATPAAPERNSFGLTVLLVAGKLQVTSLVLNSAAAESGIAQGMILSYLNGKTAADFPDLCAYLAWYKEQSQLKEWVLAPEGWKDGLFLTKTNLLTP